MAEAKPMSDEGPSGQRFPIPPTLLMLRSPLQAGVSKHALRRRAMNAWVYILRCSDGSCYVGSTRAALERCLAEHQSGAFGGYTAARLPVVLVYSESFVRIEDAVAAERQIKGWSRAKKEALIAGRFDLLPGLASRKRS